ncbi:MAG: glutaredoxin family protein [Nitrospinota bacterium]|nr:glutaredoxin family protein [Nitrospinota bacterium]
MEKEFNNCIKLTMYTKPECSLCEKMKEVILDVSKNSPLTLEEINISGNQELEKSFGEKIPLLFYGKEELAMYKISRAQLIHKLKTLS